MVRILFGLLNFFPGFLDSIWGSFWWVLFRRTVLKNKALFSQLCRIEWRLSLSRNLYFFLHIDVHEKAAMRSSVCSVKYASLVFTQNKNNRSVLRTLCWKRKEQLSLFMLIQCLFSWFFSHLYVSFIESF